MGSGRSDTHADEMILVQAMEIIGDLVDDDPCSFDHHGYCQSHAWFATEQSCPHGRGKALLARWGARS